MRRFLAVLAVLSLLVIPVDAAETTKYVALTFDDGPSGRTSPSGFSTRVTRSATTATPTKT